MIEGITIQVLAGEDRPVIVKTATTPEAREVLRREVDRLRRARHPGVVEIVSATEDRLEVGWIGAHTLETARLAVPAAAAVLAAVSETVADLHAMGIVHGRLDPGHVVLTGDGRPVLCGMVGPDPSDLITGPADDVAAVGRLIDHLLGPEADPEPIPERRWSRKTWSGYHRRALQTLADRAAHDDPARRPTARALANAIVEAVPEARLQPAPPGESPRLAPDAPAQEVPVADEPSVAEEVAGSADAVAEDWLDPFGLDPYVREPSTPPPPVERPTRPRTILGLRLEEDGPVQQPDQSAPVRPDGDAFWSGADRATRSGVRTPATALLAAAVLVVSVLLARAGGPPTGGRDRPTLVGIPEAREPSETGSTATEPSVPPSAEVTPNGQTEAPTTSTAAEAEAPDPTAEAPLVVQAGITYAIGEPGDAVGVADWDCDGSPTPGVVRPATGEVFLFDRWATPGEPVVSPPSLTVPDASELVPPGNDGGCTTTLLLGDGRVVPLVASSSGDPSVTTWSVGEEVQQ